MSSDVILERPTELWSELCVDEMREPADESWCVDRDQRQQRMRPDFEYDIDSIRCRHISCSLVSIAEIVRLWCDVRETHRTAERGLPAHPRMKTAGECQKRQVSRVRRCGAPCCGTSACRGHPTEGRREEFFTAPVRDSTAASSVRAFHQQRRRSPSPPCLLPRAIISEPKLYRA